MEDYFCILFVINNLISLFSFFVVFTLNKLLKVTRFYHRSSITRSIHTHPTTWVCRCQVVMLIQRLWINKCIMFLYRRVLFLLSLINTHGGGAPHALQSHSRSVKCQINQSQRKCCQKKGVMFQFIETGSSVKWFSTLEVTKTAAQPLK